VIVVDSSGWLEFFTDGPIANLYAPHLTNPSKIVTPTIILHEVYKSIRRERTEEEALVAVAQMEQTSVVDLTPDLALASADLALEHRLAMADAIVYATSRAHSARLITSDSDFAKLPGVTYFPKPSSKGRSRLDG